MILKKMKIIIIHVYYYISIFIILSFLPHKSFCADPQYEACVPKICGNQSIKFPFYIEDEQESYCGYPGFNLSCISNSSSILEINSDDFRVDQISYESRSVRVSNAAMWSTNASCSLPHIRNVTLSGDQFVLSNNLSVALLTNCTLPIPEELSRYVVGCDDVNEWDVSTWGLVMNWNDANFSLGIKECNVVTMIPILDNDNVYEMNYVGIMMEGFDLNWRASDCGDCETSGGHCGFEAASFVFKCYCPDRPHSRTCKPTRNGSMKLILATAIPGAGLMFLLVTIIFWKRKKLSSLSFVSKETSSDIEDGSNSYNGMPVFSYKDLQEATHNFDPSKELGDGGFGTVYHGTLRDGREVAVKRLYEHNYKRVEQFMNEIDILTRLRHHNLVLLYGSTSHRSRDLLLVYEYIPNGTVADHLHGDRAAAQPLPWTVRMNIAVQTASALLYLHKSEIIHRDVKTNNILLDNNFVVKVADFGLSKLFPTDVSHISTAPQGTPGYVDPEYHQCYQLTVKSDVYSFGVVLIELISSMPAVDISRQRNEINLANLAIDRIQRCALNELIDPTLGHESDANTERMITSVAELAFRCLQLDKDLRPTMEEVLVCLKQIQGVDVSQSGMHSPSPESENVVLLKGKEVQNSPVSVADKWISSRSTTPNTSTSG